MQLFDRCLLVARECVCCPSECDEQSRAAARLYEALATLQQQVDTLPASIDTLSEQKQQNQQRAESGHKRQPQTIKQPHCHSAPQIRHTYAVIPHAHCALWFCV